VTPAGLARTHAAAFGDDNSWPARDFANYIDNPICLVLGNNSCFVVIRLAGPEAEVITLATHPEVQGQGRATKLLRDTLERLRAVNVQEVFLDVSDQNTAARALYARSGFTGFALRHNYYKNGATAICMKAVLSPASSA